MLHGTPPAPTPADIVAAARAYLGVRWLHQGRSRQGLDCIGLILAVARDLGLADVAVTGYGRLPNRDALRAGLAGHLQPRIGNHQPGDVLLMRFERDPQHVAIATDVGLIHAAAVHRRVVEHRLDGVWADRIVCAYRWPSVVNAAALPEACAHG